jgi:ParB/RepB/Spo0J family partition protein
MEKPQLNQLLEIYCDQISEPIEAMRTDMDRDSLYELASSIKANGLIEPIILRWHNERLEIVAGHRRFRANLIAGNSKIKCIVKEMTDEQMMIERAHENLVRQDIDPVDQAIYVAKMVGDDTSKVPEIAKMLGYSEQWVYDRLDILHYPEYFLEPLKSGKIKLGVAKFLAQIEDETYRSMFFDNALRDGMTVATAQYCYEQWKAGVFKPTEIVEQARDGVVIRTPQLFKARCAKCGTDAIEPNVTSVFVHMTCPDDEKSPSQ